MQEVMRFQNISGFKHRGGMSLLQRRMWGGLFRWDGFCFAVAVPRRTIANRDQVCSNQGVHARHIGLGQIRLEGVRQEYCTIISIYLLRQVMDVPALDRFEYHKYLCGYIYEDVVCP